ncbi:MAG: hypothetical protein GXY82_02945 [Methanospirillum sp.]|nr:hypothetical protein [Methanospirillum sp.]
MHDRVCPLVSGRNGLLVRCLGEGCGACRTTMLVPDGETVVICTICDRLPGVDDTGGTGWEKV